MRGRPGPGCGAVAASRERRAHRRFHDHVESERGSIFLQPRSRLSGHENLLWARRSRLETTAPHPAELPNIGAGWAAVPDAGPGQFPTSPPLPRACAPCGGPDPPLTGDHRAGPRRVHPHDRRDRDMRCTGAAQVPASLTKVVVEGFGNGTTASCVGTRPRRARRGQAWARSGTAARTTTIFVGCTQPSHPRRGGRARHRAHCE